MASIRESHEAERGCGFRVKGGSYLVGEVGGFPCGKMPFPLVDCDHCGRKWKQGRSLETNVDLDILIGNAPCKNGNLEHCSTCPTFRQKYGEGAIDWVGSKFYDLQEFLKEAAERGASRRIPKNHVDSFIAWTQERGGDMPYVALAHPHAIDNGPCQVCATGYISKDRLYFKITDRYATVDCIESNDPTVRVVYEGENAYTELDEGHLNAGVEAGDITVEKKHVGKVPDDDNHGSWVKCQACNGTGREYTPGIFQIFKPSAIEYVIDRKNDKPEKWDELEAKGVKLVEVIEVKTEATDSNGTPSFLDSLETVEGDTLEGADGRPLRVGDSVEPVPEKQAQWKASSWPAGSTATVTGLDLPTGRIQIKRVAPKVSDLETMTFANQWVRL